MIKKISLLLSIILLQSCSNENIKSVEGEWELYREKFIASDSLDIKPDKKLFFPGKFQDTIDNNDHIYGSIKKRIMVEPNKKLSLYVSGIYSASKIWIDNEVVGHYGKIARTIDNVEPLVKPIVINFKTEKEYIDVVIEFSNFHLREHLIFKWLLLGDSIDIYSLYIMDQSKDYFSAGILFIISILFFLLFLSNRRSKYNLYFSLFSLSYGVRSFLMVKASIQMFIPIKWELIYQLTSASELWSLIAILLFFKELYPRELNNKFTKVLVILGAIFSLALFLPITVYSEYKLSFVFFGLVLVTASYFLLRLILIVKNKRFLSKLTLVSLIFFSLSIFIDILSNRYIISWDYVSAQAVIFLVLTMCILIAKDRSSAITAIKEKKNKNLKYRNTFSRFVPLEILSMIGNKNLEDRAPGDFLVNPQTIAFIDIRDFTKMSQVLTPEENFILINNFFKLVGDEVYKNEGFIESYGGDGVKVVFPLSPESALNAAKNISRRISLDDKIRIGISIHVGNVVLGTIGSEDRIQTTSISSITRVIGKMDHFNSKMGIEILITENVMQLSNVERKEILSLGKVKLKDEDEAISLYQVTTESTRIDPLFKECFEHGVEMLELRQFSRALGYFELAARYNKDHRLNNYYIEKLQKFLKLKKANFTLTM